MGYASDVDALVECVAMTNPVLLNRRELINKLEKAEKVIEAAKNLVVWFEAASQDNYEKTVKGQTLESASENWDDVMTMGSADFQPLLDAFKAYDQERRG